MLGRIGPLKSLKRNSFKTRQFLFKIIKMVKNLFIMKTNFLIGQARSAQVDSAVNYPRDLGPGAQGAAIGIN